MGSVCGKFRRTTTRYEVTATSVADDAQVQSDESPLKKAKGAESGQQGSDGGHNSTSEQHIKAVPASAAAKPTKPDPKDFMYMNLKSELKVKPPGTINGQQFIIDTCEGCDLFVMDACAMVTIDDCKDCRIFIGPTESSIFIRDCTNCQVACITRQLRTRDCHSCNILVMSRTRPIIESSTNIGIGCYSTPYAGLAQQMALAKLNPFHNFWSDVFDFTPAIAAPQQQRNWKLLPTGTGLLQLMGRVPDDVLMLLRQQGAATVSNTSAAAAAGGISRSTTGDIALEDFFRSAASSPDPGAATGHFAAATAPRPEGPVQEDSIELALDGDDSTHMPAQAGGAAAADRADRPGGGSDFAAQDNSAATAAGAGAAAEPLATRTELSEDDMESVIVTAAELCDVQQLPEGCFVVLLFAPGHRGQLLQWVAQQFKADGAAAADGISTNMVLLRTNEAAIEPAVLKQVTTAAGWPKERTKQLTVAAQQQQPCIGLEVRCGDAEQRQQLESQAESMSGLCCSSLHAAKLFRNLGTDG